jgi:hypothetical protein
VSFVTIAVLENLFQNDFDLVETSAFVSRYLWKKKKVENELKKLLNKECVEDKQLIIVVDKATSQCNRPNKELLMKLLQQSLEEQWQKTCWDRDWRLISFTFIRDTITDNVLVPGQKREAMFNLCRSVGGVIYQDVNIGTLEIPLFHLVLHTIVSLEKCEPISLLIDEKIIFKLIEEGLM